jgi:transposase
MRAGSTAWPPSGVDETVRLGLDALDQVRRRGAARHARSPRPPQRPAVSDPPTAPPRLRTPHRTVLGQDDRRTRSRRPQPADRPSLDRRPRTTTALPRTRPAARRTMATALVHRHRRTQIPERVRLARTIDAWREELLAYFDTDGVSNGPTQAMNGLIKKIKRIGHGYRNFANYRLRLLLHCGITWHTPAVTPIRGRLPRLAA